MSTIVNYKKGEVVYLEGSFEMAMYHILKGSVLVYANYKKDSEMLADCHKFWSIKTY